LLRIDLTASTSPYLKSHRQDQDQDQEYLASFSVRTVVTGSDPASTATASLISSRPPNANLVSYAANTSNADADTLATLDAALFALLCVGTTAGVALSRYMEA
jgi:hypothetical protein